MKRKKSEFTGSLSPDQRDIGDLLDRVSREYTGGGLIQADSRPGAVGDRANRAPRSHRRCPSCGGMVRMPCVLCGVQQYARRN
jgi:hypothetical protein